MRTIVGNENIIAFHPGYYIADIIEDMGISQSEFAARVGVSEEMLDNIVNGRIGISSDIARKFSVMLGTSAEVWFDLQRDYDWKLVEIQQI
ncbi:MAG: HigA family addiction module antidote protein [Lachnospiraceae bacterium]|nr:HigA family addiction module antidote protein [Lachnospiraceae bacterium]